MNRMVLASRSMLLSEVSWVTEGDVSYVASDGGVWFAAVETWFEDFEPLVWTPKAINTSSEDSFPKDNVNNPAHYGQGKIEAIDYIEDFLTEEEYQGYLRGNIAKYLHRFKYKNGVEDLKKAQWYLNRLIEQQEKDKDP
jgi:hypothetical protein